MDFDRDQSAANGTGVPADATDAPLPVPSAPAELAPSPSGWEALLAEMRAVRRAVEAQVAGQAEMLDADAAATLVGLSRSSFYRQIALGNMPQPIKLGPQLRRWRRRDLIAALDKLP